MPPSEPAMTAGSARPGGGGHQDTQANADRERKDHGRGGQLRRGRDPLHDQTQRRQPRL